MITVVDSRLIVIRRAPQGVPGPFQDQHLTKVRPKLESQQTAEEAGSNHHHVVLLVHAFVSPRQRSACVGGVESLGRAECKSTSRNLEPSFPPTRKTRGSSLECAASYGMISSK